MSAYCPAILAGLLPAAFLTAPAGAVRQQAEIQAPSRPQRLQISQTNGEFFVRPAADDAPAAAPPVLLGKGIQMDAAIFRSPFQLDKDLGQ